VVWHGPDETERLGAKLQVARIRIAILEDRIRTHRRVVRDGWTSRWRPDRSAQPNERLWSVLGDEDARP